MEEEKLQFLLMIKNQENPIEFELSINDSNIAQYLDEYKDTEFTVRSCKYRNASINTVDYFKEDIDLQTLSEGIIELQKDLKIAFNLDEGRVMDIVTAYLDATELAESAYDYTDDIELLELEKVVMAQYRTVEDLWTELDEETQKDILINNNLGEELTEKELLSKYDVEDLWDEFNDKSKRKITGITLGTNYATSIIEKNTNIQDLIEMLVRYTNLTLKEIRRKCVHIHFFNNLLWFD